MKVTLLLILLFIRPCSPAKILVFSPKFAFSHMTIVGKIADAMQEAGHDVTVFQPVLRVDFPGTGCQKAKVVQLEPSEKLNKAMEATHTDEAWQAMWSTSNYFPIGSFLIETPLLQKVFSTSLDHILNQTELIEKLKKERFDAFVHEMFDHSGFGLQHLLQIPVTLGVHTCVLYGTTASYSGLPQLSGDVPDLFGIAPLGGSFLSRLAKLFYSFFSNHFERGMLQGTQKYLDQKYGKDSPSIKDMIANFSFIFVNSDPLLDFPRPTLHKIVNIGGIGVKQPRKLYKDWLEVLSRRKQNVLISFGTVTPARHMPKQSKRTIVHMGKEFPNVTFIWKYEDLNDGTGKGVPNLHLSNWTPQADLLASGKIDLFVTHGGAGSIFESATHGVPTIGIPIFADQMRNVRMIERFGCGKMFIKTDLKNKDAFKRVLEGSLQDQKLKERAQFAKKLLKSRPFSPKELLIRNLELALKFGDSLSRHLTPDSRNYNFIQYYNFDVYLFIAILGIIFILTCAKIVRNYFFIRRKLKKE